MTCSDPVSTLRDGVNAHERDRYCNQGSVGWTFARHDLSAQHGTVQGLSLGSRGTKGATFEGFPRSLPQRPGVEP